MPLLVPTPTGDQTHRDAALVSRTRSGDAGALAALFERYGPMTYRVALGLTRSEADAEDVLQDVFVGLPEALRGFEGRGSLVGWLKRVAVRAALMRMRGDRRRREVRLGDGGDDVSAVAPEPAAPPDDNPARVLDAMTIDGAIARLPEALREVFVLREVEGYSHDEIAALLGIRRGTSEVRLFRARQALREMLRGSR
jgi:RNA polymerase sigma-70 factor, ECF subfamily